MSQVHPSWDESEAQSTWVCRGPLHDCTHRGNSPTLLPVPPSPPHSLLSLLLAPESPPKHISCIHAHVSGSAFMGTQSKRVKSDRTGFKFQFCHLPLGIILNVFAPPQRVEILICTLPACQEEEGMHVIAYPSAWHSIGYQKMEADIMT